MSKIFVHFLIGFFIFLFSCSSLKAQEKYTISGYIKDAQNGEILLGSNVYVSEIQNGAVSNVYGFYSITLEAGEYNIRYSYTGYNSKSIKLILKNDTTVNLELGSSNVELNAINITGEKEHENVTSLQMGVEKIDIMTIKSIPQFLGEVDVVRSIQMLPGVTTVGEGASGFNVRGGSGDQNLILLDEAPVYNSSHLFGFFSVFNPDAINNATLYKSGIPAKYGGRLSSVMDVRQKDGNIKKFEMEGGLGLLSSRLLLQGPIVKDKMSFIVSGRRSYADLFLFLSSDPEIRENTAYFYDFNSKVNYKLDENNKLFLSGYFGKDIFNFSDQFLSNWGNSTASLRWNHIFDKKLFSNLTAIYSNYSYALGIPEGTDAFEWTSNIINYNLKYDLTFYPNPKSTVDAGVSSIVYRFKPGRVKGLGDETIFNDFELQHEHAVEPAIYVQHDWKASTNFSLSYGLRYSFFNNVGKGEVFKYANDITDDKENIIDTVQYSSSEIIKSYDGIEPRILANYKLNDLSSLKASYNRTKQYIHLVSNTTSATPVDVWAPSGEYIKPATADHYSLGYYRNFDSNTIESSIEVYYKEFTDLLDYKDGAQLLFNEALETELLTGKGRAYGMEFSLRRKVGLFYGWFGYTLSKSERQVTGINSDNWYDANYDKSHEVSLALIYTYSDNWEFSSTIQYMSGRPITYPDSKYEFEGIIIPNYGNRNGARTPSYHRLDLAATNNPKKNKDRRYKTKWTFAIYNLYARKNPYSIFFRQSEDNPTLTEAVQLAVIGTAIPSVTFNFSF
ncbi:MAG: TonB-dependent receptor [Bacteroidia bacterium]|nr:TonB-dependent receptor [Bacteroidia bacterium]